MKTSPLRFVLALIIGVVVAYCVDIVLQSYAPGILSYGSLPVDATREFYIEYLHELPPNGVVAIILSCAIGAFSGGYMAARIATKRKQDAALGVGIFSVIILLFMAIAFSFPVVIAIGIVVVQIPFVLFGGRLARSR